MRVAVLVPGIMGSSLSYGSPPAASTEIWGDDMAQNYQRLFSIPAQLSWTGRTADARLIETFRATRLGLPVRKLWDATLSYLSGRPDFAAGAILKFGYDWRASLFDTGAIFLRAIDDELAVRFPRIRTSNLRLTFITHSMGGLLVRSAIGQLALPASRIETVIHVGSPLAGAPDAFYAAYGGSRLPFLEGFARYVPGRNHARFYKLLMTATRTFPSIYELMPVPSNKFLSYTTQPSHRFSPFDSQPPSCIDPQFLASAGQFQTVLMDSDALISRDQIPVYTVATDNHAWMRTHVSYEVTAQAAPVAEYQVSRAATSEFGDGTVLADSARGHPQTCKHLAVMNISHSKMCNSRPVVQALSTLL